MNFKTKTSIVADIEKLKKDLDHVLSYCSWNWSDQAGIGNSIGLNHRPGAKNQWIDNWGSLIDTKTGERKASESDFSTWNDSAPNYTTSIIESLAEVEQFKIGRVRYLRLEKKTGLTVHKDFEPRYHIALKTTPHAFFGKVVNDSELTAKCFNIPEDGYFYRMDTRQEHFVYNGSWEDRIHLVVCAL